MIKTTVFICYAHIDELRLKYFFDNAITDQYWFDRLMITSDDKEWFRKIVNGICESSIILVVGESWHKGYITRIELTIAIALKKTVLFMSI